MSDDNEEVLSHPAHARLFSSGPKRVLALDGGGVRGIVTIAFLKEMECQLREKSARQDLVMADIFDQIGGTSVGSMIATMLALGMEMAEIEATFRELAPKIFSGRETIFGQKRFDARPLVNGVRSIIKDETLGSPRLQTGLVIVAKRADTGAVWVLSNNPKMPYYDDGPNWRGNKRYKLESLVRASTAAPFLFTPANITIHTDEDGEDVEGQFIDGGVSPHNNPALQLLLMAALASYKLNWRLSPKDLLLISVGTGHHRTPIDRSRKALSGVRGSSLLPRRVKDDINEAAFAAYALRSIITDNAQLVLKTMQAFSEPRFSWMINSEIGGLENELILDALRSVATERGDRCLLSFQRYDLPLDNSGAVAREFDVEASLEERRALHAIDDPTKIDQLFDLASRAARKQVSLEDFDGFL